MVMSEWVFSIEIYPKNTFLTNFSSKSYQFGQSRSSKWAKYKQREWTSTWNRWGVLWGLFGMVHEPFPCWPNRQNGRTWRLFGKGTFISWVIIYESLIMSHHLWIIILWVIIYESSFMSHHLWIIIYESLFMSHSKNSRFLWILNRKLIITLQMKIRILQFGRINLVFKILRI